LEYTESENAWPFDTLKQRFIDFSKIVFWRPKGRLCVLSTVRLLKTSLKRLRPSRFFRCPGSTKYVRMAFQHLETSLNRIHQSGFLRRPEGRLWVHRAIRLHKHHLTDFVQVVFRCPGRTKWVRMASRQFETSLHLLHQSRFLRRPEGRLWVLRHIRLLKTTSANSSKSIFLMPRMQKVISHGLSTHWNIASSSSPKPFLKTSRRQTKCSQAHSPT
jgi:hypothetical protein